MLDQLRIQQSLKWYQVIKCNSNSKNNRAMPSDKRGNNKWWLSNLPPKSYRRVGLKTKIAASKSSWLSKLRVNTRWTCRPTPTYRVSTSPWMVFPTIKWRDLHLSTISRDNLSIWKMDNTLRVKNIDREAIAEIIILECQVYLRTSKVV